WFDVAGADRLRKKALVPILLALVVGRLAPLAEHALERLAIEKVPALDVRIRDRDRRELRQRIARCSEHSRARSVDTAAVRIDSDDDQVGQEDASARVVARQLAECVEDSAVATQPAPYVERELRAHFVRDPPNQRGHELLLRWIFGEQHPLNH